MDNCSNNKMLQKKLIISIVYFLNLIITISSGPQQKWTAEIVEVNTYTSNPNLIDLGGNVVRLGRGKYGFSGFWNLKVDLNDDVFMIGTAQRSTNREGPYFALPMGVDNETLTSIINKYYKPHVQPIVEKCCKNALIIENEFKPPLTKRAVEANNCEILTTNLPNVLLPGYYRVRLTFYQPGAESYAEGLFLVEN